MKKLLSTLIGLATLLSPVSASAVYIVDQGGTGVNTLPTMLLQGNTKSAISGTSSPTVATINATSTTASSSFANGLNLTGGCFSILGACLFNTNWSTTSSNYWLTQTPLGLFFSTTSSNYAVGASIAGTTTTALAEGTNLYFTNARAVSALAGLYEVPLTFIAPLFRTANSISWFGLATTSQPASSNILVSNGTNGVFGVATTTATCTGTVTCAVHTVIGASPVTINGSGASSTLLIDNNTFSGLVTFVQNIVGNITGNAGTATKLATPRAINGVNFDGSAAITINAASSTLLGDNNTFSNVLSTFAGLAAKATQLATPRAINGVNFDGTAPITINAASSTLLADNNNWSGINKNANGNTITVQASYVVSTSTKTGDFTDVQSAINALPSTGGLIHVKCGTYTLPTGINGIAPTVSGTIIEGEGLCTQFNFDKANTTNAIQPNTSNLTNITLRDFYIHQTNATFGGIGINASNTPLIIVQNIKIDGTATSTSIKDTKNLSFYQVWENLDLRGNTSCLDIGGNPVNDNKFKDIRCATQSGNNGFAYYIDSSSSNGAQGNVFDHINSEPTGAGTGLTGIYCANCVDNQFIAPYIENNATGWNMTSNSQRNTFHGGEFVGNTTYTNAGSNNQWLGVDKETKAYNLIMASTTIADVSGNDATVPSLSFIGNTNFAKASQIINMIFSNTTDTGDGLKITNPGSGNSINVVSGKSILQAFTFTNATGTGATTTTNFSNIFTGGFLSIGTSTASTTIYGNSTSTFAGGVNLSNGGCFSIAGVCLSTGGSGALPDWNKQTNFGVLSLTPTTTIPVWANNGIYASSTSQFANIQLYGSSSLQNFTALNATTSNATTTTFNVSGLSTVGVGTGATLATNIQFLNNQNGVAGIAVHNSTAGNEMAMFAGSNGDGSIGSISNSNFKIQTNNTAVAWFTPTGSFALASSTPWGFFSINAFNKGTTPLMVVSSSTGSGATTSPFVLDYLGNLSLTGGSTTLMNFTALNSTSTNATSTNFFSTIGTHTNLTVTSAPIFSALTGLLKGNGSSPLTVAVNGTDFSLNSALSCGAGSHLATVAANGVFTCTADTGTGGGDSFTHPTSFGTTTSATTTALWTKIGLYASTTFMFDNATGTSATTTNSLWSLFSTGDLGRFRTLTATGTGVLNQSSFQNFTFVNATGTNSTSTSEYAFNTFGDIGQFRLINATGTTATSTFSGAVRVATSSNSALTVLDKFGTTYLNVNSASTTGPILEVEMATNTDSLFTVLQNRNVGVSTSSPQALFAVHGQSNFYNPNIFMVASSSKTATTTHFQILASGSIFAPDTIGSASAQTGYWCYDANGQLIRDTAVCIVSARKFKKDIIGLDVGLSDLLKFDFVSYYKKTPLGKGDDGRQMGVIADDVANINPALKEMLVTYDDNGDVHGFRYDQFTALLGKSIQDLNKKIDDKNSNNKVYGLGLLFALYVLYNEWDKRKKHA